MAFNVRQIFAVLDDEPIVFDELLARALTKEIDGTPVRIASIPHLIEMKQRAGRPRDLEDIDKLRQLLEDQQAREP